MTFTYEYFWFRILFRGDKRSEKAFMTMRAEQTSSCACSLLVQIDVRLSEQFLCERSEREISKLSKDKL